jgi:hypothetical protein
MPDIELKDLNGSIGTELFADTESFLEDLTDDAANILGGIGEGAIAIAQNSLACGTTVALPSRIRPEDLMTAPVYNPHPGGNSGINCTGFYTTVYNPHKPPHRRPPIYHTFATGAAD